MPGKNELTIVMKARDLATRVFKRIGGTARLFGKTVRGVFRGLRRHLLGFKALFAAAIGGAAVKSFAEFESGIAGVSTLVDTATVDMKNLAEGVKEVARVSGDSFESLNKGLFDAVSAGVPAGEAIAFLGEASKLAVGGLTDTSTAVDGLTSIINAYGMAASDVKEVSDSLFQAQKEGKTTIAELSANIGKVAPIANQAGLSMDELTGTIAALTKNGLATEESATALRNVLTTLIKPSKEATAAAKALGIQWDSQALATKGLVGVFAQLEGKAATVEQQMALANNNVRSFTGVAGLAANNAQVLRDVMESMGNKTDATNIAFKKISDTIKNRFKRAFVEIKVGVLDVFEKLRPQLIDVANTFADMGKWIQNNAGEIAAWGRLAFDVMKVFFSFVSTAWNRYSTDTGKLWTDLGALIKSVMNLALEVITTTLKLIGKSFVFAFRAIRDELRNTFKGFSLSDLFTKGDAFAQIKEVEQRIVGIRKTLIENAELIRQRQGQLSGVPGPSPSPRAQGFTAADFPGIAPEAQQRILDQARTMVEVERDRAEILGQINILEKQQLQLTSELAAKIKEVGGLTPEEFGIAATEHYGTYKQEALKELEQLTVEGGEILSTLFKDIGQGERIEELKAALSRFRKAVQDAKFEQAVTDFTERIWGETPQEVAKKAKQEGEQAGQAYVEGVVAGAATEVDNAEETFTQAFGTLRDHTAMFEYAFRDMFESVIDGSKKLSDAIADMVLNILSSLRNLFLSKAFSLLLNAIMSPGAFSLSGSVGAPTGAPGFGETGGFIGPPQMALGGITSGPTIAGEGSMREAVVPLPNGRSIQATITDPGGGGGVSVTNVFNVSAIDGQDASRVIFRSLEAVKSTVLRGIQSDPNFARTIRHGGGRAGA